jgi:hypothetical protein
MPRHTKFYIEQFDDINGVIRERKSKKDRQCHGHTKLYIEQFDDTNEVIRGRKSKTDRQFHGHTKLYTEQLSSNCSVYNLV